MLGTPAEFPASVSLLASISPLLLHHLSPESVTAFSFICIYFPLPSYLHPFSSIWLHSSVSPSLLPCIPALPSRPITGSSRAQQTLPQVFVYLACSNVPSLYDVVSVTLLGWHVSPGDIMFTLFVFAGNRHLHHA